VGHCQPRHVRKAHHLAGEEVESLVLAVLVADGEQELQPQANAEERLAAADVLLERGHKVGLAQPGNGVAEGADAGQHDLVGLRDAVGVGADLGRKAELLEGLLHAAQVGHAVINDDDLFHGAPATFSPSSGSPDPRKRNTTLSPKKPTAPTPPSRTNVNQSDSTGWTCGAIQSQQSQVITVPAARDGPNGIGF